MKKLLVFLIIVSSIAICGEEYNIREKEIVGEDKWERDINIKDKKDITIGEIDSKEVLSINLDNIGFYDEIDDDFIIDDIKIENIAKTEDMTYNITIYSTKNVVADSKDISSVPNDNYVIFSSGGYKNIDAFKYIVDYAKTENDVSYYLHLGRDINGKYRDNSNIKIDNYFGKLWYKNFDISASHTITDKEIPGQKNMNTFSDRESRETELNTMYKLYTDGDSSFLIGGEFYHKGMNSDIFREYNSDEFGVTLRYEDIYNISKTDNILDFNLNYKNESRKSKRFLDKDGNLYDVKNEYLRFILNNNIKLKENKDLQFYVSGGIESAKKETMDDEVNYFAKLKGTKRLTDNFEASIIVEKNTMNKDYKTILNSFIYDDDIIATGDLNNEDQFDLGIEGVYMQENYMLSIGATHKYVKNKLVFSELRNPLDETQLFINGDSIIGITNHFETLNWMELTAKAYAEYGDFKTNMKYIFSTLKDVGFSPKNTIDVDFIYSKNRFETKLNDRFYSNMFNSEYKISKSVVNTNRKEIENYNILSWYNTYRLSETVTVGFNIENILGENKDYKTNYPLSDRKYVVELKIKY